MRLRDSDEVRAWLDKADRDLRMVRLAMGADVPLWDQACFHAQQAAEKALKGLLVAADLPVPRNHDLLQLIEPLMDELTAIESLEEAAALLTQYGVGPRYPSFLAPETQLDAGSALESAERIVAYVLRLLPD